MPVIMGWEMVNFNHLPEAVLRVSKGLGVPSKAFSLA